MGIFLVQHTEYFSCLLSWILRTGIGAKWGWDKITCTNSSSTWSESVLEFELRSPLDWVRIWTQVSYILHYIPPNVLQCKTWGLAEKRLTFSEIVSHSLILPFTLQSLWTLRSQSSQETLITNLGSVLRFWRRINGRKTDTAMLSSELWDHTCCGPSP